MYWCKKCGVNHDDKPIRVYDLNKCRYEKICYKCYNN